MKKIFRKININKNIACLVLFLFVAVTILGLPKIANADVSDAAWNIGKTLAMAPMLISIGTIAVLMMVLFGAINSLVIGAIINLTKYNNFINESSIIGAWVVIRDLCNMFFILILLVVAFAAILRVESYQWKKILPKLLIMAVLINFSRTFCGLIIDFSQIIMLTFVNAWSGNGGGFVLITQMTTYFTGVIGNEASKLTSPDYSVLNIVVGMLIGIMFLVISGIVLIVALAVFLMRVIMLWIYIVLSPLAFLAAAFPAGQKYAAQWWSEFIKYIINGPVLAFFIWMAFVTSAQVRDKSMVLFPDANGQCFGLTQGMCLNNFLPFIISIGMLLGGLMITQQIGGVGASIAGKGLDWAKKSLAMPMKGLALGAKGVKSLGSYGVDKLSQGLKMDLNLARVYKRFQAQREENKRTRETDIYGKAVQKAEKGGLGGRMSLLSTGDLAWRNITNWNKGRNLKRFVKGGKWAEDFEKQNEPLIEERKKTLSVSQATGLLRDKNVKKKKMQDLERDFKSKTGHDIDKIGPAQMPLLTDEEKKMHAEYFTAKDRVKDIDDKLGKKITGKTGVSYANVNDKRAKELTEKIAENKKASKDYALFGKTEALEANRVEAEGLQAKKISNINNPEQLGQILREAVATGNEGLIRAIAKKMTKNYDYNEMCKAMGVGTGHEGLLKLADKFQSEAGMTKESSLSLLGELGVIAKNIGHYAAFGAVKMDNGRWEKASEDEYNQAQLAEMLKQGTQEFARNTNRLGLGYYESPKPGEEAEQTMDNWHLNKSAIAAIKLMAGPGLVKHYTDRADQNSMEFLNGPGGVNLKILIDNNVNKDVIQSITARVSSGQGRGADVAQQISQIKT